MIQELVRRTISPAVAKIAIAAMLGITAVACGIDSLLPFVSEKAATRPPVDAWIVNVNFAYILALLVHWYLIIRSGEPTWVSVAIARCGAVVTVICFCVALVFGHFSIAATVACCCNAGFVLLLEAVQRQRAFQMPVFVAPLCVFASVLVALYVARTEQERIRFEQLARESFQKEREANPIQSEYQGGSASTKAELLPKESANWEKPSSVTADRKETGERHRIGPTNATARLVFYCDYADESCRRFFPVLEQLMKQFEQSTSLTVRHYPAAANNAAPLEALVQPYACRPAAIAEAAFEVAGEEGFWKQHAWLLQADLKGKNLDASAGEATGTNDVSAFQKAIQDPKIVSRIMEDVVEARARGVTSAPALLLNGQRLSQLDETFVVAALKAVLKQGEPAAKSPESELAKAIDTQSKTYSPQQQLAAVLSCVRVENPVDRSGGSGVVFAVRGNFVYVLTAAHLVRNAQSVEVQTFSKEKFPEPAKKYSWSAVVASSAVDDVAVVRFSTKDTIPTPLKLAPRSFGIAGELQCITVGCDKVNAPPSCKTTNILAAKRVKRSPTEPETEIWEAGSSSVEGRSGGPILNSDNLVLGIASGNADGKGYFCHIEGIYRLLSDNGLQSLVSAQKP